MSEVPLFSAGGGVRGAGGAVALQDPPTPAPKGLADYSLVDIPGWWYKSVNFGAEKIPIVFFFFVFITLKPRVE